MPTSEQVTACESRRHTISESASRAPTAAERDALLLTMPNCRDVYAVTGTELPTRRPPAKLRDEVAVGAYVFLGVLAGLVVDGVLITPALMSND